MTSPDNLQKTFGRRASSRIAVVQGSERVVPDSRFAQVIEHEGLVRQPRGQRQRRRQLTFEDEDVVGQAAPGEPADAADDVLTLEKVIGLGLCDVAHAAEERIGAELVERRVEARRTQIDPADNAPDDRVTPREVEQDPGLVKRLIGLNGHAAADAVRSEQRPEVRGQKIPTDGAHVISDPAIARCVVPPEVLMRVDACH